MGGLVAWPLEASTPSLAAAVPDAPPGSIVTLSAEGGYVATPREFTLVFGRESENVHVPIGADDRHVSRQQGEFTFDHGKWWMRNLGQLPIRLPRDRMLLKGHGMPVPGGYLPLLIGAPGEQEHLLEVRIVTRSREAASSASGRKTLGSPYDLSENERLVLTSLAQRYLRGEEYPQPVTWGTVTDDMRQIVPDVTWISRTVQNVVERVRRRLSDKPYYVRGLRAEEIQPPLGNTLNVNLIRVLLESSTLLPEDLSELPSD
ncbi:FHA domain-containing protein [Fodinicola acaciae]|uniref:FHA domain-containing protein n=1 Tax=Fodinicola acaciae TaxID=2681555 RepID=UPI0013D1B873|nr:FHA domain-containing protein [Fodinicola acaciae]